jgi:hypothetical protein
MKRTLRHLLLIIVAGSLLAAGAWVFLRFQSLRRQLFRSSDNQTNQRLADSEMWTRAVEKVKEDRGGGAIEIPPELRHYEDRHWFLATQVAEVRKFNLQSCQDFVDLAAMIERGELVSLPGVTENYILFGVGAKADGALFSRYINDRDLELYDEAQLRDAYGRLDTARSKLRTEISNLQSQLAALKKGARTKPSGIKPKQGELQKEITTREEELKLNDEAKTLLDQTYGQTDNRQKLLKDHESLQKLAKNFGGRSFDLNDPSDRKTMKVTMLSSLRPGALKILEEIAKRYHDNFYRPLPVSSLVRPEQYQHALRKVNRNAVLIDNPPHSTGLAFDIDYRYMSGAEQTFVMMELARLKNAGQIEVIRERNANYHVFAFIDGQRPRDELITASLDQATAPVPETNHATKTPAKVEKKSRTASKTKTNSKVRNTTSRSKAKKRR